MAKLSLSELQSTVSLDVEIREGCSPLTIRFCDDSIRLRDIRKLDELQNNPDLSNADRAEAGADFLMMIGLDWDLFDGEGNRVEVTRENLLDRGVRLIGKITAAINGHLFPNQ